MCEFCGCNMRQPIKCPAKDRDEKTNPIASSDVTIAAAPEKAEPKRVTSHGRTRTQRIS